MRHLHEPGVENTKRSYISTCTTRWAPNHYCTKPGETTRAPGDWPERSGYLICAQATLNHSANARNSHQPSPVSAHAIQHVQALVAYPGERLDRDQSNLGRLESNLLRALAYAQHKSVFERSGILNDPISSSIPASLQGSAE